MNREVLIPAPQPKEDRGAFTIVELLVACAIVCLLVGVLLPAVNGSREAARRIDCMHRLQQIGLALHAHHNSCGTLPPGWTRDPTGASAFGWLAQCLPYAEAGAVHDTIDQSVPLGDGANVGVCRTALALAQCPSDVQEPVFALYQEVGSHALAGQRSDTVLLWLASGNFLGVFGTTDPDDVPGPSGNGPFIERRAIRLAELERGLSETLLVGERTFSKCPSSWIGFAVAGEDAESRVVGLAASGPNYPDSDESEFSSRHPGCANFLWADGHVTAVADSIDSATYRRLATRSQVAE